MITPLKADASSVGALFSASSFEVPKYQREYSWQEGEIEDFWLDLSGNLESDSYFLGLVILTNEETRKHVVDGQQRIVTLTLLATALYYQALRLDRRALADRINTELLKSIDYETDETFSRVILSDENDNHTLQTIISSGKPPGQLFEEDSVSARIVESYRYINSQLTDDLKSDPFKRLGKWTDFLTNKVYFAVFVHPDAATAYQVFEVINTRGRDLTTADLLKNYVLSQTPPQERDHRYLEWQSMSQRFPPEGSANTFVQFIRHVVTVENGHVLPKDLFNFLAQRKSFSEKNSVNKKGPPRKTPPSPAELVEKLSYNLPLYLQTIDPTASGPADDYSLQVFSALNSLNVIAVRPIILAVAQLPDREAALQATLQLVVRRIVVGNLGTGNVERRLSEAARNIFLQQSWSPLVEDLADLNPPKDDFIERLSKRSLNKGTLAFLRRSILQRTMTPEPEGTLHLIWPRNNPEHWIDVPPEEGAFWATTIGNTFLSELERRPGQATDSWQGFKDSMLHSASDGEWVARLNEIERWTPDTIAMVGRELAEFAANIWYPE